MVQGQGRHRHRLIAAISRSVTHAMNWLGAEFAIAGDLRPLLPVGLDTGARMVGTCAVPYPDDRYRTVAIAWRRSRTDELSTPFHQQALRMEGEQLARTPLDDAPSASASTRTRAWRPLILDLSARDHREVLRVLREDPSLQVIDRLAEQRQQLSEVQDPPGSGLADESYRWVYYPWRRAVVRLLPPPAFNALRLDRNRNKLTRAEQARLRTLRIGVVGLSAGHTIAHVLAMEGLAGELRLADFDTLELSNLNRVPASVLDLGVNKAIVAARRIGEIDPYLSVVTVSEGIGPENLGPFLDDLDLVIEECDSLDVKLAVREAARERQIPVLMETSDRGVLDVERFDLEPERPIFHGLLPGVHSSDLAGLSIQEKAPHVLRILGPADVSSRGAASLLEVGVTITGWPQLGSEITLGAATVAAAVRRFGTAEELGSGRVRIDLDEALASVPPVRVEVEPDDTTEIPDAPLPPDRDPIEKIVDAARRCPVGRQHPAVEVRGELPRGSGLSGARRTTAMDVHHRGSYVAIGAALFNARVTAASLDVLGPVDLFPEGSGSSHVATLHLGSSTDPQIAPLEPRVWARAANRKMGDGLPVDEGILRILTRSVEREGARLHLATEREQIADLADLVAEADRLRFLIPTLHAEMVGELRWPGKDALEEGLDVRTLELSAAGDGGARHLAPARRHGASGRLASGRGARGAHVRDPGDELGPGARHRAQSRAALVRARRDGRREVLDDRGAPRAGGPARVTTVHLRRRRRRPVAPRRCPPPRHPVRPVPTVQGGVAPRRGRPRRPPAPPGPGLAAGGPQCPPAVGPSLEPRARFGLKTSGRPSPKRRHQVIYLWRSPRGGV